MNGALDPRSHLLPCNLASRRQCWRYLAVQPMTLTIAFASAVLTGVTAGVIAACAALAAVGVAVGLLAQPRPARRLVSREIQAADRRARASARAGRLEGSGSMRCADLAELSRLVDEIEDSREDGSVDLDLQDLLDAYVDRSVAQEGYRNALRTPAVARVGGGPLHAEVTRRRAEHRETCRRLIEQLDAELDAITELIRLVAQRALCPAATAPIDDLIRHRLWELDTRDEAIAQLAAD